MKKSNAYIVLTHTKVPTVGGTGSNGWKSDPKNKEMQITESVEFLSRLPKKMLTSASVIVDYQNEEIIKNRMSERDGVQTDMTFGDIKSYLESQYPEKMKELDDVMSSMAKANIDEMMEIIAANATDTANV